MKLAIVAAGLVLAGCASTPAEQVSNWDICRYTMGGGDNARVAQREAQRRGLDCAPYYPAINAKLANENAAMNNFLRQINPPPPVIQPPRSVNCTSRRTSNNTVQTDCW
jgi:hypothetical protein